MGQVMSQLTAGQDQRAALVGDIVVSVCYRPPDQEEVDEAKN